MSDKFARLIDEIGDADPDDIANEIRASYKNGIQDKRVEFKDRSETLSPFTTTVEGPAKAAVEKVHQSRTERAQTVDEKQNAPVTTDEEKWLENPNRYDYPGVDTIPRERQQRRAERAGRKALEKRAADRVEQKGSAKRLQGKFAPDIQDTYGKGESVARVQGTAEEPERTLAHEVGHAFDYSAGADPYLANNANELYGVSQRLFDYDQEDRAELEEEAIKISKRGRGDFENQQSYRREHTELTADLFAQAVIEPRATRREAPKLFDRFTDIAEEEGFGDVFQHPLSADPEKEGFLD